MSDQLTLDVQEDRASFISALTGRKRFASEGARRKARGMSLVDAAVDSAWAKRADAAIATLAASFAEFTAEDVCRIAGRPDRPNAVGSRLSAWARKGLIYRVDVRKAGRPDAHARLVSVWKGRGI